MDETNRLLYVIERLQLDLENPLHAVGISENEVFQKARELKIDGAESHLTKLRKTGLVFNPMPGFVITVDLP